MSISSSTGLPFSTLETHSAQHTSGSDDIQSSTSGQNGLATSTQIAKLDGIEAGATNPLHRVLSGALTAGIVNAICFSFHYPVTTDGLIMKVVIEITTGGGTAGAHLVAGIADDTTGTNLGTEFFNGLLLNNASIYDSTLNGDAGTQTKWVVIQDSASATGGWVVGKISDANASSLVGKYHVECTER